MSLGLALWSTSLGSVPAWPVIPGTSEEDGMAAITAGDVPALFAVASAREGRGEEVRYIGTEGGRGGRKGSVGERYNT